MAGYNHKLKYQKKDQKKTPAHNSAKEESFGLPPPLFKNYTSKVGKFFLSLMDRHFPPRHKLHKMFFENKLQVTSAYQM